MQISNIFALSLAKEMAYNIVERFIKKGGHYGAYRNKRK